MHINQRLHAFESEGIKDMVKISVWSACNKQSINCYTLLVRVTVTAMQSKMKGERIMKGVQKTSSGTQ